MKLIDILPLFFAGAEIKRTSWTRQVVLVNHNIPFDASILSIQDVAASDWEVLPVDVHRIALTPGQTEQLFQVGKSPVWAGDLIDKTAKAALIEMELMQPLGEGFFGLTYKGRRLYGSLREKMRLFFPREEALSCDSASKAVTVAPTNEAGE